MKLPAGKIDKTYNGSQTPFQDVINEVTTSQFDGYLEIISRDGTVESLGFLVFQKGSPVMAIYEAGSESIHGDKALEFIFRAANIGEVTYELHKGIDVSLMIMYFPRAKLSDDHLRIDSIMSMYNNIAEKIAEEKEKKAKIEARIREIKDQIDKWEEEGYVVLKLKNSLDKPIDELENMVTDFTERIEKLKKYERELDEMMEDPYEDEITQIMKMCNDPDKVQDIEREMAAFKERLTEDNQRREAVKKKIMEWKEEGYTTDRLEVALNGDVEQLWETLTKYMEDIQTLDELRSRLSELDVSGYEDRVEQITSLLKNPDKIDEIKDMLSTLEKDIEREKERRKMIAAKVEGWEEQGIVVSPLKESIDTLPLEELEKKLDDFEERMARADVFRSKLGEYNVEYFREDINRIEEMLKDPYRLEEVEKEFQNLDTKVEIDQRRRTELREKLNEYKKTGYIIPNMEEIFNAPIDEVEKSVEEIERTIVKLKGYEEKLQELRTKGYEKEILNLLARLYDLSALGEVQEKYDELMAKVAEDEKKREGLIKSIKEWEEEGFDVSTLKPLIDGRLDKLWEAYTGVYDSIQILKEQKERIEGLNPLGHEKDVEALKEMLKYPAKAEEAVAAVDRLEELVNEELARRSSIKSQLDEWASQGYNVDEIMGMITSPMEELETAYTRVKDGVEKITRIKERLKAIDVKWHEDEAQSIRDMLSYPNKAEDAELALMELEMKIKEEQETHSRIMEKITEFEGMGYNVEGLKKALNDSPEKLEAYFNTFSAGVAEVEEIKRKIKELEIYGHDQEIEAILVDCADLEKLQSVRDAYENLKAVAEREADIRNNLLADLQKYADEGYEVTSIMERIKSAPISESEEIVKNVAQQIERLKAVSEAINSMTIKGHTAELDAIKAIIKNPADVDEVEEKFNELKKILEEEENKRNELKKRVQEWKEEGYNVERLEQILEGDLEIVWEQFTLMMDDITKLQDIEEELKNVDMKGHDDDIKELMELVKDPERINELERKYAAFKDKLTEEQKQIEQMKDTITRWKEEGIIVTRLDNLDEKNYEEFRKKVGTFQEDLNRLKALKSELQEMDTRWFEQQAREIEDKMNNPDALGIVERKMDELKKNIEAEKQERASFYNKIEEWKSQGFNVEKLKEGIDDISVDDIRKRFMEFEEDIHKFQELQKKLGIVMTSQGGDVGEYKEEPPMQLIDGLTFDTFVVGASNRFTHAAAQAVANNPAEAYNPLFIYGGVGLGKTHLINAIGHHIKKTKPELKIMYVTTERFINELLNAVRHNKVESFRRKYREADVLLIDDIQFISGHMDTQEEFFHTFNALHSAHKQIVLTSDRPPKDIAALEDRLRSRFEGGLITDIQPPSLETKIIILRRMTKKEGIQMPDEVTHYIASNIKTNIRQLEGALTKIIAYVKHNNAELTVELAEKILKKEFLQGQTEDVKSEELPHETKLDNQPEEEPAEEAPQEEPIKKEDVKEEPPKKEGPEVSNIIESKLQSLKEKLSNTGNTEKPPSDEEVSKQPEGLDHVEEEQLAECSNCGKLIPISATVCPYCGAIFEELEGEEDSGEQLAECGSCGKLIPMSATVCPYCGARFDEPDEPEKPEGNDSDAKKTPSSDTPTEKKQDDNEDTKEKKRTLLKKKKKKKKKFGLF